MTTLPEAVPAPGTALVLVLHAHLPWQLRRGAWPHGSDWLGEAVCESYLPLLDTLDALARDGVPVRWTVGVTPVLAAQLGAHDAPDVLRAYVYGRLAASAALRDDAARDEPTRALGRWWHDHYAHCLARLDALDFDLLRALRAHADAGRVELMGSAATHAVLPLLARDESVVLQLDLGRRAHARTFGAAPAGCWLPECAYRPAGWWQPAPWAPSPRVREGIHAFVRRAGFGWTIVDAHLPRPVASARAAAGEARAHAMPDVVPERTDGRAATPTPRETRSPWAVLAAWAEEIAEARRTGQLPPAVPSAPAPRDDLADALRPHRTLRATPAAGTVAASSGVASRAASNGGARDARAIDAALRVARAAFDDGAIAPVRPWPVFDDLDAFLRAARAAADGTSGGAQGASPGRAWPWPDASAWRSGAFPLDSGVAMESGAFPFDSGVAMESGAFPLDSGAAMESGAFPFYSGAAMESGAFPFDSGVAMDSGAAMESVAFPFDSGVAMDSGAAMESGAFPTASGAAPLAHDGIARDSGVAHATASRAPTDDVRPARRDAATAMRPLEFDESEARRFADAARGDDGDARAHGAPALRIALPDGWPHALHQWRGPFVGPGTSTADAWRATLGALAPAVAHRPWRVAESLDPFDAARVADPLALLVRDPVSARLVWSRQGGYPGSAEYLEFHRRDDAHGLRLWRVTSHATALDAKGAYDPAAAADAARRHAAHFAAALADLAQGGARVVVAPFDAELFGHWWREGPDFLAAVTRALAAAPVHPALGDARPVTMATASEALAPARGDGAPGDAVLDAGSWGALGSFAMWLNARTAWLWRRLWPLEERFWAVARVAIDDEPRRAALVQAARELLLAQASDWPFMLTRDEAADHAARRVTEHMDACEALLDALVGDDVDAATALAATHARRDDCFDAADVVSALRVALAPAGEGDGPRGGGASARAIVLELPVSPDATGDDGALAPPAAA